MNPSKKKVLMNENIFIFYKIDKIDYIEFCLLELSFKQV